MKPSNLSMKVW